MTLILSSNAFSKLKWRNWGALSWGSCMCQWPQTGHDPSKICKDSDSPWQPHLEPSNSESARCQSQHQWPSLTLFYTSTRASAQYSCTNRHKWCVASILEFYKKVKNTKLIVIVKILTITSAATARLKNCMASCRFVPCIFTDHLRTSPAQTLSCPMHCFLDKIPRFLILALIPIISSFWLKWSSSTWVKRDSIVLSRCSICVCFLLLEEREGEHGGVAGGKTSRFDILCDETTLQFLILL